MHFVALFCVAKVANGLVPWHDVFEKAVLDVRTSPVERVGALASLAGRWREIAGDDREGARAVVRQLEEVVVRERENLASRSKLLREEVANVYGTPQLEEPSYSVEKRFGDVEIRIYDAYVTATTPTDSSKEFSRLASYVFGDNDEKQVIGMTMPVEMDYVDDQAKTMSFSLPRSQYVRATDAPGSSAVDVEQQRDSATYAAVTFPGIATPGEIQRQLDTIYNNSNNGTAYALSAPRGSYKLLQYNPPYTLPFRRLNALLVPVTLTREEE